MDSSKVKLLFQLFTIVFSVISVVIGYVLAKKLEMSREKRKYKAELFIEYISISNKIDNKNKDLKKELEYSTIVEKLCLYANENVLTMISQFHEKYNNNFMETDEGKKLYSELIIEMRKDVGLKVKKLSVENMINILELNT
jgi:hypothetical protein